MSVAISKAREFGFTTVSCASTGNLATAVAAHAARAGPEAATSSCPKASSRAKIVGSTIYGAQVITIRGNYDDVNRLCSEIADKYGWAFVNINLRPYYTEGAKTFGFEVAEQLGWRLPDHIVVPTAGGTILPKVAKAFKEFKEVGLIKEANFKIHSAQAAGSAPVIHALHKGTDLIRRSSPTRSRSRSRSEIPPTATMSSRRCANPADGARSRAIPRLSTRSSCWRAPKEFSPSRPAAPRSRSRMKLSRRGASSRREGGGLDYRQRLQNSRGGRQRDRAAGHYRCRLKEFDALFERLNGKRAMAGAAVNAMASQSQRARYGSITHQEVSRHAWQLGYEYPLRCAVSPAASRRGSRPSGDHRARSSRISKRAIRACASGCWTTRARLRRFVNIYLNGDDIRFLKQLNSKVKDGDDISIVPAIAGGR